MEHCRYLRRRYGLNALPFIGLNSLLFLLEIYRFDKSGKNYHLPASLSYVAVVIIINIVTITYLYGVFSYRIGVGEKSIFVKPLLKSGPYLEMQFADIDIVDLKRLRDLGASANTDSNPAVIVLYRKGWDGDEVFALDPARTNLRQFKDLVQRIHNLRPETFTEDALRYINGPDLITPRAASDGNLGW